MFADALEVEENIRLSGRFPDQGGIIENDGDLKWVELHEMEEEFPWQLASSSNIQKEDHHGGGKVSNFTIPSLQDCN